MTLQLKKYFFRSARAMIIFFLLVKPETISAQKKSSNISPPDHLMIQYAGGIGFMSIGAGYSNKNQKLEADFYYGYLPKVSEVFAFIDFQQNRKDPN